MKILPATTQPVQVPQRSLRNIGDDRPRDQFQPSAVSAQEMQLMRRIQTQEWIMAGSYTLPVAAIALGYMGTNTALGAAVAIPVGVLLAAGIADYLSGNAQAKIDQAQAQLDALNPNKQPAA